MKSIRTLLFKISIIGLSVLLLPIASFAEDSSDIPSVDLSQLLEENDISVEEIQQVQRIIPGSFFHFVYEAMESLQFKLALSDYGKAHLLAQFTQERLDTANTLLKGGMFEEAESVVEDALNHYLLSKEYTSEVPYDVVNNGEVVLTEEDSSVEEHEIIVEEEMAEDLEGEAIDDVVPHPSILSLLQNIKKIDNPKAVAALTRNVERKLRKMGIDPSLVFDEGEEERPLEVIIDEEPTMDDVIIQVAIDEENIEKERKNKKNETKGNKEKGKKENTEIKDKKGRENKNGPSVGKNNNNKGNGNAFGNGKGKNR
ncbi:DUF5667 domain-containing protein [Evansella tamaricis]|uniref:DUF5667 domain-containing protein n=1 Tax=Evansella tamaricis TaxID=2069301 RepID=A0ABS6JCL7_9BACI|nr:DUF5667 domain-containing protein [Evansella tamaricis]MBU9711326.1 hypothetical protein [Evansella tamaricis]